ncbi:glycosyl transferase [Didymella glomerata]|uniref:Glycosyl transferase n=1 Tax=Didymella glomerata TaxID=749621 RepID=A0A9W9C0W4_9PLEO|nr:glycosyl transferase [Didymella glomerata]
MVLFKRKPVKFDLPPKNITDHDEVWVIEKTGEVYNDYEKYLRRLDFYDQKLFTCESTGHSGYTFFEAMESQVSSEPVWEGIKVTETQTEASREIDSIFSDVLRSRVLHFVQFRTTPRMDDLVNLVFDEFKEQYMVGDRVCIEVEGPIGRRYGVITDITDNSQLHQNVFTRSPDDQYRAYTYIITMDDNNEPITKYKAADLQRDRKYYSKLILKQFLRSTVSRESWIGAPWMAKDHLAKRYKIPTKIPENKTREMVMAQRKLTNGSRQNGASPVQQTHPHQLPNGHAPQANGHRAQQQPQHGQGPHSFVNFANPPHGQHPPHLMHPQLPGFPQHMQGGPPPQFAHQGPPQHLPHGVPLNIPQNALPPNLAHILHHPALPVNLPFQHGFMQYQQFAPRNPSQQQQQQHQQPAPLAKPFEPIKYPIEDLDISQPRLSTVRPTLKFFSDDVPDGVESPAEEDKTGILMKSLGPLLCAWETLNVHDTIYMLDSFTFDDFAEAMRFSSEERDCELFVEVHCSVLKQIINENGKLQAPLPNMAEVEDSDEDVSSEESTPTPEPEPPKRTTRSSLRKSEVQQIVEKPRTPTPEPPREIHKAADFIADFDWIEQLKIRNFQNGGWQAIMVALLYRLSFDPIQKEICDEILTVLVPGDQDSSMESIAENYRNMDVNLRIAALDQALRLTVTTEAFRDQLNAASLEMTRLRKEKIEFQRKRKELADELFKLDLERKIKLPENTPASPSDAKENEDVSMLSVPDSVAETADGENEDEDASAAKSRTRTKNKRKAAAEEARKEKAKKAKIEAEKNKKQKEWEKLLKAVDDKKDELKECEANINELDDDLRETLVHRSKVLGKDRFLNKYYWFEHNGMPFGGVPNSSTAEYGYANGRIWVQGPDAEELQPCLEEPALSQDMQRFKFTIPQRKEKEEGSTHLSTSMQWAYYDDPEDIDRLIVWLDERGHREKQLRKELQIFRDRIAEYMEKMKKHLTKVDKTEEDEEDEDSKPRISTRGKANAEKEEAKERCLLWTNSIMFDEYGYIHSTEYEPPKKGKARVVKATKGKGRR